MTVVVTSVEFVSEEFDPAFATKTVVASSLWSCTVVISTKALLLVVLRILFSHPTYTFTEIGVPYSDCRRRTKYL